MAKWLAQKYYMNVHSHNEYAFRDMYHHKKLSSIEWFMKEYDHSKSPYFCYNGAAYILNHEKIDN